ncbi:MAG: hypothetical protein LBM68_03810 [Bacteroidales bacterium]|jgi:hypothetical protein|nr:hypothetical protein [Bacteroidales bacterium]
MKQAHSLEDLRTMFETNPRMFNIIEEPIDVELQVKYFKRSQRLKKQVYKLEDVLARVPQLYDENIRVEEKRDILILLASFNDNVQAYRALETFWNTAAQGDVRPWAAMAYRESKMSLESSLLDEKQVLISTGLGGKGYTLRYFICFIHNENVEYTDVQQKILRNELSFIFQQYQAECEKVEFSGRFAKVFGLIPFTAEVREILTKVTDECNQYGNFISPNFMVTNVKALDDDEIDLFLQTRELEQELANHLSDMGLNDVDFDFDDDDDE